MVWEGGQIRIYNLNGFASRTFAHLESADISKEKSTTGNALKIGRGIPGNDICRALKGSKSIAAVRRRLGAARLET
jgi:hypothetical protein